MSTQSDSNLICISSDVILGKDVHVANFVNLYGCQIGDYSKIGAFVEIQKNATIGQNCKISSHTFICEGVEIRDNVFIGHNVTFINDKNPASVNNDGYLKMDDDWILEKTIINKGVSIGPGHNALTRIFSFACRTANSCDKAITAPLLAV